MRLNNSQRGAAFGGLASLFAASLAHAQVPTINEKFVGPWQPSSNPDSYGEPTDGLFKVDGNFCVNYAGAYPVEMQTTNGAELNRPAIRGENFTLTVPPATHQGSCGTAFGGAETMTGAGWTPDGHTFPFGQSHSGYGYYEVNMRPSCTQGEVSSFFWIAAPNYGPLELDVEFPNPPGHTFTDVHWTIHPSGKTVDYQLGFNPCSSFHRYGFLWTPGQIVYTVDGAAKYTFSDSTLNSTQTGFLMANAWTGNPNWGGGPPAQAAVNTYRWIRFLADAKSIPAKW